jgi:Uma2 family endonuclease
LPDSYNPNWVAGSRIPDIVFFVKERFAEYKAATPDWGDRPYAIVPDLVIEVVSPNDQYSDIDAKVDLYLADGVRIVWVIDPQRRKVHVHTSDRDDPHVLKGDEMLKGGDVLPGFEIALTKLFE